MTAVLNAVQETHSGTGIKTIDQGRYFVHIVEGELTYGIFFSHENDLKVHNFANTTLQGFEFFFNKKIKKSISFNNDEFIKFQDFLNKKYSDLISIDVVNLSKIIEIMEESIFSDYIILEKPNFHQVFTHISSLPEIHKHANQIASMCKSLLEASLMIGHETTKIEFNLGENYYVFTDCFVKYCQ